MSERNLKQDLIALTIGAFVVFLATALITYHANDKVEPLIAPLNHLYQADVVQYPQSTSTACLDLVLGTLWVH